MFTISYFALCLHSERSSDRELKLHLTFSMTMWYFAFLCLHTRSSISFYFPHFVLCSCLSVSIFDKTVLRRFHLCFWSHVFVCLTVFENWFLLQKDTTYLRSRLRFPSSQNVEKNIIQLTVEILLYTMCEQQNEAH